MIALILIATLGAAPTVHYDPAAPASMINAFFLRAAEQVKDVKVGQWVKYEMTRADNKKFFMQISVVGAQKDELGRDAIWVEYEFANHQAMKAPMMQMRFLTATGDKEGFITPNSVTRGYVAFGIQKPAEVTPEVLKDMFEVSEEDLKVIRSMPAVDPKMLANINFVTGKPTALMTAAGTVTAVPLETRWKSVMVQRLWVSEQIPIMKIAKLEIPRAGHTVEIRDFGSEARSRMVLPAPGEPKFRIGDMKEIWGQSEPEAEVKNAPKSNP